MPKRNITWLASGLVAVASACAPAATTSSPSPAPPETATAPAPSPSTLERAARADSLRASYVQADVDFMAGMIHHHAQALVMSRMAPTHGASPALEVMAARIINGQNDEIALMQRWLRERGEPVPDPEAAAMDMAGHGGHHEVQMAGMLTPEQLARLDAARGAEWDRLFLTYMIQHHQGAVTMVNELFDTYGAAQGDEIFKIASDIAADQASEIDRMQSMLREMLFGAGQP